MRSTKLAIALIAIAVVAVAATLSAAEPKPPVAYFLDPTSDVADDVPINLPADAKDVVVAKVRFERAIWLGGRHCEGCTNDILFTRVKITEVKRGRAEIGQVFDVRMGVRNDYRKFVYPSTPDQLGRMYTVVIYSSDDGLRRLAWFPISPSQYAQWDAERSAYQVERSKPGHRE